VVVEAAARGARAEVHKCGAGGVVWAVRGVADASVGAWFGLEDY
jgi:hypothetical protein